MATAWITWNTSDATTTSTAGTWGAWNTSTSAGITSTAWSGWVNTSGITTRRVEVTEQQAEQIRLANERYQAEATARQIAYQEKERKRKEEEKVADERAEELLYRHLNGRQRRQYRRNKSFIVTGKDGHNYKVDRLWSGHVTRLNEKGRGVERFCIHPTVMVPLPDNQLVAKLMLETDPEQFRRIANVTQLAA